MKKNKNKMNRKVSDKSIKNVSGGMRVDPSQTLYKASQEDKTFCELVAARPCYPETKGRYSNKSVKKGILRK